MSDARTAWKRFVGIGAAALCIMLGALAPAAGASTWYVTGTIVNWTNLGGQNCGAASGAPQGCITVTGAKVTDGNWTVPPTTTTGSGANVSSWQFEAPNLDEGADGYIDVTTPDGTPWHLAQFDDLGTFRPDTSNVTSACSLTLGTAPQGVICEPYWSSSSLTPSTAGGSLYSQFEFTAVNETIDGGVGAGATCTATMSAGQSTNCSPGPLGAPDQNYFRGFVVQNIGTTPVDVNGCHLTQQWQNCSLQTAPPDQDDGTDDITIKPGEGAPSGSATYSIQVAAAMMLPDDIAENDGDQLISDFEIVLTGGPFGAFARSLTIAGLHARPRSGSRAPRLVYRASRTGEDTVFVLHRRIGKSWVALAGRRRMTRYGRRTDPQLFGHFVHRDRRGTNTVAVPARVDGRRLAAGRYRVTAITRLHRRTSRVVGTTFTVRARSGK